MCHARMQYNVNISRHSFEVFRKILSPREKISYEQNQVISLHALSIFVLFILLHIQVRYGSICMHSARHTLHEAIIASVKLLKEKTKRFFRSSVKWKQKNRTRRIFQEK